MKKSLHIAAFDVPYPADYGGVIDIYHKIRSLHKLGVAITLHCFQYGRNEAPELNKCCKKVFYYRRSKYRNPFTGDIPYIVHTRNNEELLQNLCRDNAPILFEGIHTTFFLSHPKLRDRLKLVRSHNIEHDYYKNLELVESNYFKKYFFRNESDKLRRYEKILKHADYVLSISAADHQYMQKKYHNSILIPAFHPNDAVEIQKGSGKYILYHGNLAVGENNHAALYLVKEVFSKVRIPCIIAGNNPSGELVKACQKHPHIRLVADWDNNRIMDAIAKAHINVLPTFQGTGIKLKLLNALYRGRYCVVNPIMVSQTMLEEACIVAGNADDMVQAVEHCWKQDFREKDIARRKEILSTGIYDNLHNAGEIIKLCGQKQPRETVV